MAGFESALRSEMRQFCLAGAGTLGPHLVALWGEAHRRAADMWLREEVPGDSPGSFGAASAAADDLFGRARSSDTVASFLLGSGAGSAGGFQRAAIAAGIVGAVASTLRAMPGAVLEAFLGGGEEGAPRSSKSSTEVVASLVDLMHRIASVEIESRALAAVRRLLNDASRPWQLRWRTARAVRRFGDILVEEGDASEPDWQAFVGGGAQV